MLIAAISAKPENGQPADAKLPMGTGGGTAVSLDGKLSYIATTANRLPPTTLATALKQMFITST